MRRLTDMWLDVLRSIMCSHWLANIGFQTDMEHFYFSQKAVNRGELK
jgi:hypothetical protein